MLSSKSNINIAEPAALAKEAAANAQHAAGSLAAQIFGVISLTHAPSRSNIMRL